MRACGLTGKRSRRPFAICRADTMGGGATSDMPDHRVKLDLVETGNGYVWIKNVVELASEVGLAGYADSLGIGAPAGPATGPR